MNLAGSVPLARLRTPHVELWVKEMSRRALAASTIGTKFDNGMTVVGAVMRDRVFSQGPEPLDLTLGGDDLLRAAARYVERARTRGVLPPTTPGKESS
ncbi:hypothetical protein [Cellulomonas fimi]|uniref:Uncharacterized protein n=1 Tax=Cellulomonas fimi TaxID=1708 RepID=A0A7Y0M3B9_CELFI|nr:hypothetical protein [Cellulomonas fimi]NMR21727.1 hypothetical protein [Cellulomonas fimi]